MQINVSGLRSPDELGCQTRRLKEKGGKIDITIWRPSAAREYTFSKAESRGHKIKKRLGPSNKRKRGRKCQSKFHIGPWYGLDGGDGEDKMKRTSSKDKREGRREATKGTTLCRSGHKAISKVKPRPNGVCRRLVQERNANKRGTGKGGSVSFRGAGSREEAGTLVER